MMHWPILLPSALLVFAIWAFFHSAREEEAAANASEARTNKHTIDVIDPVRQAMNANSILVASQSLVVALELARVPMDEAYVVCLNLLERMHLTSEDETPDAWKDAVGVLVRAIIAFNRVLLDASNGEFMPNGVWPNVAPAQSATRADKLPATHQDEWSRLYNFYQIAGMDYHNARSSLAEKIRRYNGLWLKMKEPLA